MLGGGGEEVVLWRGGCVGRGEEGAVGVGWVGVGVGTERGEVGLGVGVLLG